MPMTRRQFGGGVAAALGALLLPKIRLHPHYDLQAMLAPWCAHKLYSKYNLTAPYAMDGHAYATDARAMARILDDGLIVDGSARIPRETVSVWDSFWTDDGPWQPWPWQRGLWPLPGTHLPSRPTVHRRSNLRLVPPLQQLAKTAWVWP